MRSAPATSSQVQRRAAAQVEEAVEGLVARRAAEHRGEQVLDRGSIQRPDLDALGAGVLPERGDGVGAHLAGADRGEDADRRLLGGAEQDRGRDGVEEVRVVHHEQQRVAAGVGEQRGPGLLERGVGAAGGDERAERAEREGRGRAGGEHPGRPPARRRGAGQERPRDRRLAAAGRADQHRAAPVGVEHRGRQLGEEIVAADERPVVSG